MTESQDGREIAGRVCKNILSVRTAAHVSSAMPSSCSSGAAGELTFEPNIVAAHLGREGKGG
eukprot:scaffold65372_cov45-Tisochrysis_lutea.AAC.1